jgi:hypothetical protein
LISPHRCAGGEKRFIRDLDTGEYRGNEALKAKVISASAKVIQTGGMITFDSLELC